MLNLCGFCVTMCMRATNIALRGFIGVRDLPPLYLTKFLSPVSFWILFRYVAEIKGYTIFQ